VCLIMGPFSSLKRLFKGLLEGNFKASAEEIKERETLLRCYFDSARVMETMPSHAKYCKRISARVTSIPCHVRMLLVGGQPFFTP
jgi:hypothetical protein